MHVLDASRVVDVVNALLDADRRGGARRGEPRRPGAAPRRPRREAAQAAAAARAGAREPHRRSTGRPTGLAAPPFTGTREVAPSIAELRGYIDWSFFFHAWELKGRFPAILDDPRQGAAARDLYDAAIELLDAIESGGLLEARGVYGFWPAAAEGDDIVLADGTRFPMLRQQTDYGDSRPNRSLADFVAPAETRSRRRPRRLRRRHPRGGRARPRVRGRQRRLQRDHGQGAGRPAGGGFAEYLHLQVRRAWYAPDEQLDADDLAPSATAASGRRSATPPAPTTRRSSGSSTLLGRRRPPACR